MDTVTVTVPRPHLTRLRRARRITALLHLWFAVPFFAAAAAGSFFTDRPAQPAVEPGHGYPLALAIALLLIVADIVWVSALLLAHERVR